VLRARTADDLDVLFSIAADLATGRGYAAFSTGDMATLNDLFADDAVWHVPGRNSISGPKKGRDASWLSSGSS
jgi:ketosteroid isomerase-like protein